MNEHIIDACYVIQSAIRDHSLVTLTLMLQTPRPQNIFVTTRNYKNYDWNNFANCLFLEILDEHAPIKRMRNNSRPNPFVTPEIKGLMNMHDMP
ncbi:hypothetical protein P5673_018552 [Acropora cervicornis]|uniref:Uncharacterized protein n=1 Tax=Acropora cervicornis TaxID=6130 RepID=A0AAD9V2P7_ACRCE|nr:hypothetical protein P5673_018552 [Acropora cervicornis]